MGHMNDIVMPMHNAPAGAPGPRRSDRVGLTDRVALGTLNKNVLYDRDHRAVAKAHAHAHAGLRHHKPQASLSKCGAPSRPPASPTFLTPRAAGGAQTRTPENVVGRRPTSSLSPAEASPGHASSAKSSQSSASSAEGHPSPFRAPSLTPVAPPSVDKMHDPRLLLPPQGSEHRGKMTVVFDLDETLVSNRRPGASPAIQRHYLKHMCRLLEGLVEVVLWTASTEETGRPVVDQIDPKGTFFHHVVFRSAKWFSSVTHTKDLTLLGRDMERVVIIENTPNCCKLNPQNALMVEDFRGDLSQPDRTLLNVATILRGAVESGKKGISVTRFLKFYSRVADTVIDMYELGIPEGYMGLTKEEAVKRALALPEIQRPPLGIYYYSKKN